MESLVSMDDALTTALRKIGDCAPLDQGDWSALTTGRDLISVGVAADEARQRHHGDRVTFVQVVDVALENVGAEEPIPDQAGELRLIGRPVTMAAAVGAVRVLVERAGAVPVTGFALEDLLELCGHESEQLGQMLSELRQAGLAMVSEVSVDALAEPEPVFAALGASGVDVARLTVDSASGAIGQPVLRRVASWDGVGTVCHSFAPLPRMEPNLPSTGYRDLRQVALARLLVDNIGSIQVDWTRYGPKLAQVALAFGANDVDAVSAFTPRGQGWRRSPREEIRRNISAAGFTAIRRNGRFEAAADRGGIS